MAGKADGSVIIDTRMNTSGFQTGVANMKKGFDGIGSSVGKLAKIMVGVFAVKQLVQFGKEAIELGSDLSEVQNVVDVTFGNLNQEINEFASNAIEQFGLSETAAKQYTSTMGAMLKSMGFTTREAADMSMTMTGLAADMASFYNLNAEDAFYKIRAGISGETEPLKQLGINLSVANLEQYALTQGITKSYNAMTQQEQALLRYNYLLKVTADAQGDFARTSDSWANQIRILSERFKAIKATIGQGLINIFTPVVKVINILLGKLTTVANAFKAFTELITGNKSSGATSGGSTENDGLSDVASGYDSAADGAENYAEATEDAAKATKKSNKENNKYLSGLDEIRKYSKNISENVPEEGGDIDEIPDVNVESEVDYGSLAEGDTIIDKVNDKLIKLKDILANLFEPFKNAWDSEGQKTIDAAQDALSNIGELAKSVGKSFYEVWTNGTGENILSTILQIAQNLLTTVGNISARFTEAWNNAGVGTAIVQEIANIIQFILDFVNGIVSATANWAASLNFSPLLEAISGLLQEISPLVQTIGNWLTTIYSTIILPLVTFLIEVALPGIINAISGLLSFLNENQWIIETVGAALLGLFAAGKIVPLITTIISAISGIITILTGAGGLGAAISSVVAALGGPVTLAIAAVIGLGVLLVTHWDDICAAAGKLKDWTVKKWNEMKDKVGKSASALKDWTAKKWDEMKSKASAVWSTIKTTLSTTWNNLKTSASTVWGGIKTTLSTTWSNLKTSASTIWGGVKTAIVNSWEATKKNATEKWSTIKTTLSTTWDSLKTSASTKFSLIKSNISSAWDATKKNASEKWGTISTVLTDKWSSLKTTATTTFSKMRTTISSAWTSLKTRTVSIFTALGTALKKPINGIISIINSMIRSVVSGINGIINALNSVGFTLPDFLGGQSFKLNIPLVTAPQIPYLATGAVIPPNAPFMAVLGDQRRGTNVEAPLSTIEQAVTEALKKNGGGAQNMTIRIPVILDGRQIFEAVIGEAKMKQIISGRNPFEMA